MPAMKRLRIFVLSSLLVKPLVLTAFDMNLLVDNANNGLGIVNRVFLSFPVSAKEGTATDNGQLKEGKVIA